MSSFAPFDDARTLLRAAALVPDARIAWPNEPFAKPSPPSIWLAVEITGDVLEPIELGGGVWLEDGRLFVHVMTPVGQGTDDARVMAKSIANLFRGLGPRPVTYLGAAIGDGHAEDPHGAWWRLTVAVDWKYQDIAS